AKALRFGHGNALKPHLLQCFLHLVELEWLDDGFDLLHWAASRAFPKFNVATSPAARANGMRERCSVDCLRTCPAAVNNRGRACDRRRARRTVAATSKAGSM